VSQREQNRRRKERVQERQPSSTESKSPPEGMVSISAGKFTHKVLKVVTGERQLFSLLHQNELHACHVCTAAIVTGTQGRRIAERRREVHE